MWAQWLEQLPMWLADASGRALGAAVLVSAVLHVARIRSSRTRHSAWAAVLGSMLLMPVLTNTLPGFDIRVPEATRSVLFEVTDRRPPSGTTHMLTAAPAAAQPEGRATAASAPTPAGAPAWAPQPQGGTRAAGALYLLGALALLLRLMVGWRGAARLVRSAALTGIAGPVPVKSSTEIATPATVGVLRPVIVLPAGWTAWTPEKLRAVMAHESAHVRRCDPLVAVVAGLNSCVFWFHPLAWWIERHLSTLAEHACDDEAVGAVRHPSVYADVLLTFAQTVRRHGGRLACRQLGIGGNGRFERRIDRIVSGDMVPETSRGRGQALGVLCAAALALVVACRVPSTVPPLQEDAEVAARLAKSKADQELSKAAAAMTAEQVAALETALEMNPDDFEGLKKLQIFYAQSGQKVFGWNEMIARRRPLILRLIARHPDQEMAAFWRISPEADPVTYREARALWLAHAQRPDVTARVLNHAAYFLSPGDPAAVEQLIVRARALDPGATTVRPVGSTLSGEPYPYWAGRLGTFYGQAIIGQVSPRDGSQLTPFDGDAYARELRLRLLQSADAALLAATGTHLVQRGASDPARRQLGTDYLHRALAIDPTLAQARRMLFVADDNARNMRVRAALRARQAELAGAGIAEKMRSGQPLSAEEGKIVRSFEYDAVSSLPEADRLQALSRLANDAYQWAEHLSYTEKDEEGARASWSRSKKAAQDVLSPAPASPNQPDRGRLLYDAHVALALHALREGDRSAAVRHMRQAVDVPASEGLALDPSGGLYLRLVNYLLKVGERESVAEFLERSAQLRTADRVRLLNDAQAIRAGRMPSAFQYMVSRGL